MATMPIAAASAKLNSLGNLGVYVTFPSTSTSTPTPTPTRRRSHSRLYMKPLLRCAPIQQQVDAGVTIMCEPCNGKGWLLCDFCKGQKTNVKAENKRIYRRCPSCRAVGYVLCSRCKVFKCVTFPNFNDSED